MDFEVTDDQLSLRDAVARWVEKGFTFERRHAIAKKGGPTRDVYGELAELGLTGLAIPEFARTITPKCCSGKCTRYVENEAQPPLCATVGAPRYWPCDTPNA